MRIATIWKILKTAIEESDRDGIPRLGAALAFYSLFSLAPLLYVVLTVATVAFEQDVAPWDVEANPRLDAATKRNSLPR